MIVAAQMPLAPVGLAQSPPSPDYGYRIADWLRANADQLLEIATDPLYWVVAAAALLLALVAVALAARLAGPASALLHRALFAEHGEVGVGDVGAGGLDDAAHLLALLGRRQPQPGGEALAHGGVAAGAAEDEGDGGQQVGVVEGGDDVRPARGAL